MLRTFIFIKVKGSDHFVDLPITYKSRKSNSKISKKDWSKKDVSIICIFYLIIDIFCKIHFSISKGNLTHLISLILLLWFTTC